MQFIDKQSAIQKAEINGLRFCLFRFLPAFFRENSGVFREAATRRIANPKAPQTSKLG
jgi:hypothetical protein